MVATRPSLIEIGDEVIVVGQRVCYSDAYFESEHPRTREAAARRGTILALTFYDVEKFWKPLDHYVPGCSARASISWDDGKNYFDNELHLKFLSDGSEAEPEPVFVPTHPARPRTESCDLPTTKLYHGMQVRPQPLSPYQRKRVLRAAIEDTLRIVKKLRRDGYCARTPGDAAMLGKYHKKQLRDYMYVIDNAYEVEVVGILARGHHVGRHVTHQSYIGNSNISSGLNYYGQLLWRAVNPDGNHVCAMQGPDVAYIFPERELMQREIKLSEAM